MYRYQLSYEQSENNKKEKKKIKKVCVLAKTNDLNNRVFLNKFIKVMLSKQYYGIPSTAEQKKVKRIE